MKQIPGADQGMSSSHLVGLKAGCSGNILSESIAE